MKKINFENLNDYLNYIESLLQGNISEIIKESSEDYIFSINGIWYKIYYGMLVGTNFSQGKTLFLHVGLNRIDFEFTYVWQTIDDRVKTIYESLQNIYAKHLIVNHTKVKEAALSIVEFLLICDYIEKINDSIYLITKNGTKYYVKESTSYKAEKLLNTLAIWKLVDDKQILLNKIEGSLAPAITSFLNFSYYVSRSSNIDRIKDAFTAELV